MRQSSLLRHLFVSLFAVVGSPTIVFAADPSGNASVATVKGQAVQYADLEPQIKDKLARQQEDHDAKIQQLNASYARDRHALIEKEVGKLIDDRVVALEASTRKTTPTAVLAAVKAATIGDEEVKSFYNENAARINQPLEQIAPKIKSYLQLQAAEKAKREYLDSLRGKYGAAMTLEPLREQVAAVGPSRGAKVPQVTIVEFSDFQCPFCGKFEPELQKLLVAYPAEVKLVYRNLPLPSVHPEAQKAAEAAVCADRQGKFWEMHDTLFSEQSSLQVPSLKEKARRLGLDSGQFDDCLDKGAAVASIKTDEIEAQRLGLDATPATFVNGRFVNGAVSYDELVVMIKEELRKPATSARLETSTQR
jgi:protein-disulfide isomerase